MFTLLDLYDIKPWEQDANYGENVLKPEDKAAILQLRRFQKDGEVKEIKRQQQALGKKGRRS